MTASTDAGRFIHLVGMSKPTFLFVLITNQIMSTNTFGGVIVSSPQSVLVVETNQETGAFTFKDSNETVVTTIAEPSNNVMATTSPYSTY